MTALSAGSTPATMMLGFLLLRKRPAPVIVPPVPMPATRMSTLPAVPSQISGPEAHHPFIATHDQHSTNPDMEISLEILLFRVVIMLTTGLEMGSRVCRVREMVQAM